MINADGLCFPKPAFLTNSCVYSKLEKERGREREDSVLEMTSFCFVWLPPLERGAVGGW